MSEPEQDRTGGDQLLEEAAAWFARMRGPDGEASREAFDAWLSRGALHRAAYNRAAEIFAMGKVLADEDRPLPPRQVSRRRDGRLLVAGAAALILAAIGSWAALRTGDFGTHSVEGRAAGAAWPGRLAAAPGEERSLRLPDGSLVRLAAGTSLAASFGQRERRLVLDHGKARFWVAHQDRPFVVYAGGGRVTARGTIFDVDFAADARVTVRLIEGTVDVVLPPTGTGTGPSARRMREGETLSFRAQVRPAAARGSADHARAVQPASGLAEPALEFEKIRLADLIAAANQGNARPIRLADPAVGERRLSGRFRIDDPGLLANRLAALLGLRIDASDPAAIVLEPR